MWNIANKFLELLKLRDLVHIWGIFHLNDYQTKTHCLKHFRGARAPALAYGHAAQQSPVPYILSPLHHLPSSHLVDPHGHNTESTRESYNASIINAINVHSCINC